MSTVLAVAGVVIKEMYRRKDFYVLLLLIVVITLLMGSVNFFNDDSIVRYLKEICLDLIWISSLVIAITTMARQIPFEKEQRTIFPLLAKPISRAQLLVGKFLGCWIACGLALVCFYVFFAGVTINREHHLHPIFYLQAISMHWAMLGVVLGLVLLGSLVFAAPSSNGTISLVLVAGILFLGAYLNRVALSMQGPMRTGVYGLYYLIPHLEWYNWSELMIHDWPRVAWTPYVIAMFYAFLYAALLVAAATVVFRRKALN